MPRDWRQAVRPTQTFHRQTTLRIGGEDFVLRHARGETEDQIWVTVPGRKLVATADYFQSFLPNAGNGKRRQRYPEEWAQALRDMAAQQPQLLCPHMARPSPSRRKSRIACRRRRRCSTASRARWSKA